MPGNDANATSHDKPVVVLGAGGHARVLISLLKLIQRPPVALLDDDPGLQGQTHDGIEITGGLASLGQHAAERIELVNAIGSAHRPTVRQAVYETYATMGYRFATLIHPAAVIAGEAAIEQGAQVMASANVAAGSLLKPNCLINTAANIDHDTVIGEHTHVAPGATICGGVTIGPGCHIGAGATVVQGLMIGRGAVVGAGSTVLADVPEGVVVVGTPAQMITDKP